MSVTVRVHISLPSDRPLRRLAANLRSMPETTAQSMCDSDRSVIEQYRNSEVAAGAELNLLGGSRLSPCVPLAHRAYGLTTNSKNST